ncbi:MAG: hypothetical protein JOZ10_16435 [Acidobacteria bacterium]|nr:hypothetical protein [Acidobacteriota bacterium]MBV9147579.1 hypothetical protein [Acidobacteriota bacterium]MBV9435347.1 hypothetical protein [Acidobacteriota bacterium]
MAAVAAASGICRTEQEFLRCALQAGGDLLDVGCGVFYAAAGSVVDHVGTVRVNHRAASDLAIPEALPLAFSEHVRKQTSRMIVARDWDALSILLPTFDFSCCASMWLSVGSEDQTYGTLAFFDHASRRFDRAQQKMAELVSRIASLGLESYAARRGQHGIEAATYQEFSKIVGDVARDLINPLAAIFGYVELIKSEPVGERSAHLIGRLEEQVEKARKVIASFSGATAEFARTRSNATIPVPRENLEKPLTQSSRPPEARVLSPEWNGEPAEPGTRILLVQRSEAVLEFQRSVLNALGVEVIPAFSANDALDQLRSRELDAIILDDELEEPVSSKRLVWWVREHRPELADRMLLTVSRKPSAETREILELAMLPHVTKPIEVLELYSRAQQMLQSGKHPPLLQ